MDPLSIITVVASISKTVFGVSATLYTFVNETRNVDQTVKDLATEVDALSRALTQVEAVLQSPTVVAAEKCVSADENKQLWHTVYGSVGDCQKTVERIDSALDEVRKRRSSWAAQALRQVKLKLGKDEINSLRAQTHTHCSALKMALQMVNMFVPYLYILLGI
jgi:Fungal N-terminal domain of STAND proteins